MESILPDAKRDWYHIKFLLLQIPLQVVTWILKDDYINGHHFYMNGTRMKIKKIETPVEELSFTKSQKIFETMPLNKIDSDEADEAQETQECEIISFADFKKNHGHDDAG